jgi:hypothetical protein
LGQEFCKISPVVMSDIALKKKQNGNKVAGRIGKKSGKAVKKSKPGKNEDTTKQQQQKLGGFGLYCPGAFSSLLS